jgi:PhnB protein
MTNVPNVHAHLNVADAARAIAFYVEVLGAREVFRAVDKKLGGGTIVHAELAIGATKVTLAEASAEWRNPSPAMLGGSPVTLIIEVAEADAVGARLERAGATVVYPIADQFYGKREGRFVDPFGHVWIVSQVLEALSAEEIQRRVDAFPHGE